MRDWVPDNTGVTPALQGIDPTTAPLGLTLAAGQTSGGALLFSGKTKANFINFGFGVPMPSVQGASTLTNPGNITSFTDLRFLACVTPVLTAPVNQVILECYPGTGGVYPKLYWNYTLTPSSTFTQVAINLRSPSSISDNPTSQTVDQLLSQTRFMSFYFFSGPEPSNKNLKFYVDDIRLVNAVTAVREWSLYE